MSEAKKPTKVEGAIDEAEPNNTEQQAIAAMIGVEMRGVLRADTTTIIGIAARYQFHAAAQPAVRALLAAYAELQQLDPDALRGTALTVFDGTTSEDHVAPAAPPSDGRLRIRANEPEGVLLSELLVAGGFVRTDQSVRAAFRANIVRVDGNIQATDTRLAPTPLVRIKVGDQDEREVVIGEPRA
jgi:hypothetical protein